MMRKRFHLTGTVVDLVETCSACPTIFAWTDEDGDPYYFRLRHGSWRVCNDITDAVIVSGTTDQYDGVISWEDAVDLMRDAGLELVESARD